MILRDGEPGEPEVMLSPLVYHYQHRAEIEAVVQGADREAAFDTLIASIGAALATDRIVVLSHGRVAYDGSAKHLAADQLWGLMASGAADAGTT